MAGGIEGLLDPVLFQPGVELGPGETEQTGGFGFVALGLAESLLEIVAFHCGQIEPL